MNKKKIITIAAVITVSIVVNSFLLPDFFSQWKELKTNHLEEVESEFKKIVKEDSISGSIIYVISQDLRNNEKKRTDVILNTQEKIWFKTLKNKQYENSYLNELIKDNDSIFKRMNSDTLFLFQNDKKYYFILDYK